MMLPTDNTKSTKIKMHMKSENIEPQNTQKYAEIYNGSREGQEKKFLRLFALSAVKKQENTQQNAKKIRVLRIIRWQNKNNPLAK